ncbi:MAG: type II toxin-antitoxin system VapC family toxin [Blastocatellia bacterium]
MVVYYIDSSALVKRYAAEVGTTWIRGITSPTTNNAILVSLICGAEVVAAIAKPHRMVAIDSPAARQGIADFDNHFRGQYIVVPLNRQVVERAMVLAPLRALRGYDAVQLATALTARDELTAGGVPSISFVSADIDLNAAAAQEGLTVEDPQAHPGALDLAP